MYITKYVKGRTIRELKKEFRELEHIIYGVECFGTRDIVLLTCIGHELERRGYKQEKPGYQPSI